MAEASKILVVDDDAGTRKMLSLILTNKGYCVETATTGRHALRKARQTAFDLALVDFRLPDAAGVELIAPLKKSNPDLVVIMATAYASIETAVDALNQGAVAYIQKPLHMDEVLATVREALERQRLAVPRTPASRERLRSRGTSRSE